ncbi:MAG: hypothetical protein E7583_04635 [Ruminococcaceae bacterium]|nr:hypothetical protein [Oscillospiraceae bacterium]
MNSDNKKNIKKMPSGCITLGLTSLRRTMWVPIIWSVIMIVLTMTMMDSMGYYYSRLNIRVYDFAALTEELNELMPMYMVTVVFSAFFGAIQFSFLNRVNSVGFIHSMPLTRNRIFMSYYLSGVVSVLIPQIVLMLNLLLLPWKYRFLFAFLAFIVGALYSVGVYSFGVMMSMFSAKTIGSVLFTVVGLASPLLVEAFIRLIMSSSLFGYCNSGKAWVAEYLYLFPNVVMSPKGLIYVAAIVLFTFCAWLLYKRNHSELAGDLVAYPGLRSVATTICGILAGVVGYLIFGGNLFVFALFGVICSVLVNFAVRKKLELVSSLIHGAIFVVITLVIVSLFVFDITGFEKRIPEVDDIEYARVYNAYGHMREYVYTEDGKVYLDPEQLRIRDKADLETVRRFHEDLIGNRDFYRAGEYYWISTESYSESIYDPYASGRIRIEYKLKNGTTMYREYNAYNDRNRETLLEMSAIRQLKAQDHVIVREDVRVNHMELITPTGRVPLSYETSIALGDALKKDILAENVVKERGLNDFRSPSLVSLDIVYVFTHGYDEDGNKVGEEELAGHYSSNISEIVYPHYTNTVAVLREYGYGRYIDYSELPEGAAMEIEKSETSKRSDNTVMTDVYYPQFTNDSELIQNVMAYGFKVSSENCATSYDTSYKVKYYNNYEKIPDSYDTFIIYGEVDFIEEWLLTRSPEKDATAAYEGMPYRSKEEAEAIRLK